MSIASANLVWFEKRSSRYALVYYAGRLFRMVYSKTQRVVALAFADGATPLLLVTRHKPSVRLAAVAVMEPMYVFNEDALRGFLYRAINLFRDMGVL